MTKLAIVLCSLLVLVSVVGCASEEATPTLTPTPELTPTPTPAALFLEIAEPQDESVVSTASIAVSGSTLPGAIVSVFIDEQVEIADVEEDGSFSVTVTLQEGPNLIEVIASDSEQNEASGWLSVIYNP